MRASFRRLLPSRQLWKLASLHKSRFYDRLFTPLVTLWYLIFQRLGADVTLEAALCDALCGGADWLRKGLAQDLHSSSTASYSDARQRLPLSFLRQSLQLQARQMLALDAKALWHSLILCLLDGSTVRLRPHGDIGQKFPPHRNQTKSPPYWCLMRVVVGFCARTGALLDCALSSMRRSEPALACRMMLKRALGACLYVGDRNFGIFRLAQTARAVGSHVLLRLTFSRARKLLGRGLRPGNYSVVWSPSRFDQVQPGCDKRPIVGRLLVAHVRRKGFPSLTLYLFTTLTDDKEYPAEELVQIYGLRWHVELNLRYLKAQMRLGQLECKSVLMAQKEWMAGLMAYNLIRGVMLCAALHKGVSPLRLSFSCSRRHLQCWLPDLCAGPPDAKRWCRLLEWIGQAALPGRRKARPAEPRKQRHLRQTFAPLIGSREKARQQLKKSQKCAKRTHKS